MTASSYNLNPPAYPPSVRTECLRRPSRTKNHKAPWVTTSRPDRHLRHLKGVWGSVIQVQVATMKIPCRATSSAPKADRLILQYKTKWSSPNQPARRGVTPYATSGALASSRDALRADTDLRAYRPCHRRDGTAGTLEFIRRSYHRRATSVSLAGMTRGLIQVGVNVASSRK